MIKNRMERRGELVSSRIVWLILIILGFAVILIFLGMYEWNPVIDKEACHQSVVVRSSFNFGPLEAGKTLPLNCKTENICLTLSGEGCEQYPEGEEVTKIKLDKNPEEARRQVEEIIANTLYDCNWMLGEGNLDFMPHEWSDKDYCLSCARIVLDKEAREEIDNIHYGELYTYLERKGTPGGKSYLESLYPGWINARDSRVVFEEMKESRGEEFNIDYEEWELDLGFEEGYVVLSKMMPENTKEQWIRAGSAVGVGVVGASVIVGTFGGAGPIVAAIAFAAAKASVAGGVYYGGYTFIYEHPKDDYYWVPPTLYPYDFESLKGLNCYSFEFAP
jgi:hypothetical protein